MEAKVKCRIPIDCWVESDNEVGSMLKVMQCLDSEIHHEEKV